MTREEAIRDIEECVLPIVGGISLRMAIEDMKEMDRLSKAVPALKEPDRPHGEWEYDEKSNVYRCSRCKHFPSRVITEKGDKIFTDFNRSDSYNFCQYCGSDNRQRGEEK